MSKEATNNQSFQFSDLKKHGDIALALGIICILLVLLFPVSITLLDFLLAFSIATSVLILMTCLFIDKPLDLSVFPTILLVTTILRLSLNIASTRLILSNGHKGTSAAGHVIEAFGNFVMGGNLVIGAIVFMILTIINFVVITKGSGRIAEVAARFSLDAMPGKQMAIDADLSAGLIDEATAKKRRKDLEDESTFFGAMDGANKFVRGDAVAGLLITFVNLIAGIIIGMVQRDLSFAKALQSYTILTIGDGLVSQIPALIISLAAGLLVSKSGITGSTDKAIFGQLSKHPQAMALCSFLTLLMAFMPGIPTFPFMVMALISGAIAFALYQSDLFKKSESQAADSISKSDSKNEQEEKEENISSNLALDNIRLELGYNLIPLINYSKGHKLTDQIKALRGQMARDLGFIMPSVRIQDNIQLENNEYVVKVKDIECGRGKIQPSMLLVMDPKGEEITLKGEKTTEPAFGLDAMWIAENQREQALYNNYTVVDPPTVITTHLTEIVKENIAELMTYTETQNLIDEISEDHKKLVDDLVPNLVSLSVLQRILQNLLSENVSIKDLPTILEAVAEASKVNKNISLVTEYVRMRLARQISFSNLGSDGYIPIVTLSSKWEKIFMENLVGQGEDKQLSVPPSQLQEFINDTNQLYEKQAIEGQTPCLVVNHVIRPHVRAIIERFKSSINVLSQNEIHQKVKIKTLGQI